MEQELIGAVEFCERYATLEEARVACQCDCPEPQGRDSTYYHCSYGNCCGYHCVTCGKFETV